MKRWFVILVVLIAAMIPGLLFRSESIMSGYIGAVIGGAISGLMTLYGVIYTIEWYREQDRRIHAEQSQRDEESALRKRAKQENQLRLLLGELRNNRTIMRMALTGDSLVLTKLQDVIWLKLQTELDWLDPELFKWIFDLYSALHEFRTSAYEAQGKAATLKLGVDDRKRAEQYVRVIETIRDTVTQDFPNID
jgi:hypothetical protein